MPARKPPVEQSDNSEIGIVLLLGEVKGQLRELIHNSDNGAGNHSKWRNIGTTTWKGHG